MKSCFLYKVSMNSVQCSKVSQPIRGRVAILGCFFPERPEKRKLGWGRWDLSSCQVSMNSVQRFQRRSRKCEKLNTDGRRTTRDHNSALEPKFWRENERHLAQSYDKSTYTHRNMNRDFYLDVYTILNRITLTKWTICTFRVLNPRQWSLAKQSNSNSRKVMPQNCQMI